MAMLVPFPLGSQGSAYCPASLMPEHDKEGRAEMRSCVLKTAHYLGGNHVSSDAHDEQLPKVSVEYQFGRNPRVAASQDRSKGLLALGQIGKGFLADSWKPSLAIQEPQITCNQPLKPLLSCGSNL